jgi:hypothetical protein
MAKRLTVYKVLDAQYKSTVQHYSWPLPTDTEPGPWLDMEGDATLCIRGYHGWVNKETAFRDSRGAHVYEMEIEGVISQDIEKACGTRARLVKEIFPQPQEPWEEFVSKETSALEIIKRARAIRKDVSSGPYINGKANIGYHPVVPSFHNGPLNKIAGRKPDTCGTCGLNEQLHDGWEQRALLADILTQFDRWELVLYIQQILKGKEPGLDITKSKGS